MGILALAIAVGDILIAGVGAWSTALIVFMVFAFRLSSRYDVRTPWRTDRSIDPDEFSKLYGAPVTRRSRLEALSLAPFDLGDCRSGGSGAHRRRGPVTLG